MSKKIIVFGGSGMVGSNLKQLTSNSNFNFFYPTRDEVDLLNKNNIIQYLNQFDSSTLIINLAGKVGGIRANMDQNYRFLHENMSINLNLIDAALKTNKQNFLNISSSCIYPKNQDKLLKEEDVLSAKLEPTNEGYALAKIAALKSCDFINREFNLNYKTIIPCNLYGPFDKFGEDAHMIPAVIKRIHLAKIKGNKEIEMWGDGNARREFMFVKDLIDFLIYSVKNFEKIPALMNLGIGRDYTINEYYQTIINVIGFKGKINKNLNQPIGMLKKQVDISKQQKLDWSPSHSLINGVKETYNYFLKYEI